jgi:MATE family multidrug resistance protein
MEERESSKQDLNQRSPSPPLLLMEERAGERRRTGSILPTFTIQVRNSMIKIQDIKSTFVIVLPLMAAFLAQKGMQFIDTVMMGWLGPEALAAGAIGTSIFITNLVFCVGTLSSVGIFIARAKGENNTQEITDNLQNGVWLALFLSLPCMAVMWFAPDLLRNEDKEVIHNTALLLHGLSLGMPGELLFLVFREFISAFFLTRIIMIVTILSIPLTFALNYILIYGKWGFPALGVSGIGYAGSMVMWFMFFSLLLYSLYNRHLKNHLHFKIFEWSLIKIKDMLFIGIPSGIFFLLESAFFLSAIIMMEHFGVIALAGFQIAIQCESIVYAIPLSISMATALQVSHAIGSGEEHRIKSIAIQNFSLGLLFSIAVVIAFVFFPEFFIKMFLTDPSHYIKTIQIAVSFLIISAFFQCFDAIQAIANGMLRGLKDTFVPMLLSVGCYWLIGIASSYYLAFHTSLGPKGIWYGISIGIGSLGIVLMLRLYVVLKRSILH